MNEKALHTLEYDKIIEKLVGYAVSPMAKERAAALRPSAAMILSFGRRKQRKRPPWY